MMHARRAMQRSTPLYGIHRSLVQCKCKLLQLTVYVYYSYNYNIANVYIYRDATNCIYWVNTSRYHRAAVGGGDVI